MTCTSIPWCEERSEGYLCDVDNTLLRSKKVSFHLCLKWRMKNQNICVCIIFLFVHLRESKYRGLGPRHLPRFVLQWPMGGLENIGQTWLWFEHCYLVSSVTITEPVFSLPWSGTTLRLLLWVPVKITRQCWYLVWWVPINKDASHCMIFVLFPQHLWVYVRTILSLCILFPLLCSLCLSPKPKEMVVGEGGGWAQELKEKGGRTRGKGQRPFVKMKDMLPLSVPSHDFLFYLFLFYSISLWQGVSLAFKPM